MTQATSCPVCQGDGFAYFDLPAGPTRRKPCSMGCPPRRGPWPYMVAPHNPVKRSREFRDAIARIPTGRERYCEVCGDVATHTDLLPGARRTIHQSRVCALWQPETPVGQIPAGSVVSWYRVFNLGAPLLLEEADTRNGGDREAVLRLRGCRFAPVGAGAQVALAADGPVIERRAQLQDLMVLAARRITAEVFPRLAVPPGWLAAEQSWAALR